jgi:mono/diheme cytochrome c family protein
MGRSRLATAIVVLAMAGLSAAISAPAREKGEPSALFVEYCAKCHGEDGRAQTPKGRQLRARDFTDSEFQSGKTDADLIKTVTKGGEEMPAFGKKLSAEQIESLIKQDVRGFRRKS